MPVILTRVTIEALSNMISCSYEGHDSEMAWDEFTAVMPPPFDTKDLFYVGYEPDRNIFVTERRNGVMGGEESEEIAWIRDNLAAIVATIQENFQAT